MQPFHWKAADLARLLEKIGAVAQAGKKVDSGRTLRLTNPRVAITGRHRRSGPRSSISFREEICEAPHRHARHRVCASSWKARASIHHRRWWSSMVMQMRAILVFGRRVGPGHDHEHTRAPSRCDLAWTCSISPLVRSLHRDFPFEGKDEPRQNVQSYLGLVSYPRIRQAACLRLPCMRRERGGPSPCTCLHLDNAQRRRCVGAGRARSGIRSTARLLEIPESAGRADRRPADHRHRDPVALRPRRQRASRIGTPGSAVLFTSSAARGRTVIDGTALRLVEGRFSSAFRLSAPGPVARPMKIASKRRQRPSCSRSTISRC